MFTHLLVPLDGSELAEIALPMASAVAERFGTLLPLRSHPLPFDVPQNRIVMQWNAQRDHDGGLAWLRGLMVELCADRAAT